MRSVIKLPWFASLLGFFGLGTADDPVFPGMHDASALVAGATLAAARAVWTGAAQHGVSIAAGLHHAMRASASGFCVYNDPAIAIAWLLGQGAGRVAYVDVDVHHGDGVQAAFYDDPRVLTISLHQDPAALWPGTGLPSEAGGKPPLRGDGKVLKPGRYFPPDIASVLGLEEGLRSPATGPRPLRPG